MTIRVNDVIVTSIAGTNVSSVSSSDDLQRRRDGADVLDLEIEIVRRLSLTRPRACAKSGTGAAIRTIAKTAKKTQDQSTNRLTP